MYTFEVKLTAVKYFDFLMKYLGFHEVSRVATGGMMSEACILITYERNSIMRDDLKPLNLLDTRHYIEVSGKHYNTYYNVKNPNGVTAQSAEEFFEKHNAPEIIEIKVFNPYDSREESDEYDALNRKPAE